MDHRYKDWEHHEEGFHSVECYYEEIPGTCSDRCNSKDYPECKGECLRRPEACWNKWCLRHCDCVNESRYGSKKCSPYEWRRIHAGCKKECHFGSLTCGVESWKEIHSKCIFDCFFPLAGDDQCDEKKQAKIHWNCIDGCKYQAPLCNRTRWENWHAYCYDRCAFKSSICNHEIWKRTHSICKKTRCAYPTYRMKTTPMTGCSTGLALCNSEIVDCIHIECTKPKCKYGSPDCPLSKQKPLSFFDCQSEDWQ